MPRAQPRRIEELCECLRGEMHININTVRFMKYLRVYLNRNLLPFFKFYCFCCLVFYYVFCESNTADLCNIHKMFLLNQTLALISFIKKDFL